MADRSRCLLFITFMGVIGALWIMASTQLGEETQCGDGTVFLSDAKGCVARGMCFADYYCDNGPPKFGYKPGTNDCPNTYPHLYPFNDTVQAEVCDRSMQGKGVGRRCVWNDEFAASTDYSCWYYFNMTQCHFTGAYNSSDITWQCGADMGSTGSRVHQLGEDTQCGDGTVYNDLFGACVAKGNCFADFYCDEGVPLSGYETGYSPGFNDCPATYPDLYPDSTQMRTEVCGLSTQLGKGVGRRCQWNDDRAGYSCFYYFDRTGCEYYSDGQWKCT